MVWQATKFVSYCPVWFLFSHHRIWCEILRQSTWLRRLSQSFETVCISMWLKIPQPRENESWEYDVVIETLPTIFARLVPHDTFVAYDGTLQANSAFTFFLVQWTTTQFRIGQATWNPTNWASFDNASLRATMQRTPLTPFLPRRSSKSSLNIALAKPFRRKRISRAVSLFSSKQWSTKTFAHSPRQAQKKQNVVGHRKGISGNKLHSSYKRPTNESSL